MAIELLNTGILVGSGLLLLSVLTSLISFRIGAPLLLLFLCVGLVAGEDGIGTIRFDNAAAAYVVGSVALAVILFESGFNTHASSFRLAGRPAILLSTLGVVVTTAIAGTAVRLLVGLDWLESLLLGAIISSTDAAAVFFLLRVGGITIRERVRSTLEIESGSNDPIAIFVTLAILDLIREPAGASAATVLLSLVEQAGIGAVAGLAGGWLIVQVLNRLRLEAGLYAVASLAMALSLCAATLVVGGSGFLAAYLAGLVVGNSPVPSSQMLRRFHDGLTWLSQIVMFLTLGLFATPSQFADIALPAVGVALILIFLARPAAVWLCLMPFRFSRAEITFIAWVGLRGAVSILLAIAPILADIPGSRQLFNIAFVVVLVSLLLQGWTIRPLARVLRLIVPPRLGPVDRVELDLPGRADYELVGYTVDPHSPAAAGRPLEDWGRPALLVRDGRVFHAPDAVPLQGGDHVYLFAPPARVPMLDRLFGAAREYAEADRAFFGDLALRPDTPVSTLADMYGLPLPSGEGGLTIAGLFNRRFGGAFEVGDRISLGGVDLVVRDVQNGEIVGVGLDLDPETVPERKIPMFQSAREIARGAVDLAGRVRFALWRYREGRRERRRLIGRRRTGGIGGS
ncbi:MAG TPA: potassium/proton antiporter [Azospirillaceae bacterium]|nr:potassium/proton antiporter [Azospirillaceae bacterium]